MRSIKWKLIIMYLGLVLIVMIVSGTYILLSLRNIEIDKSRQELATYAERINEQVIEGGKDEEFQEKLLKTVSNAVGIQGNILNTDGETIASTTGNGGTLSGLYRIRRLLRQDGHDLLFHTEKKHRFLRGFCVNG